MRTYLISMLIGLLIYLMARGLAAALDPKAVGCTWPDSGSLLLSLSGMAVIGYALGMARGTGLFGAEN